MELTQIVKDIIKHPLRSVLVLGLTSVIGCQSLDQVVNEHNIPQKEITATEEMIEQDFGQLPGEYIPRYNTIAHKLMQMEKDFEANSDDYLLLDLLIERAESEFGNKETYDTAETIDALQFIGEMLRPFQKEPEKIRSSLLSKCFEEQLLDCDSLSLVYKSIGEVINLPMELVILPWHVFVRVYTEEGYINWDAAMVDDDRIISNEKYVGKENIDNWPKILDTEGIFALHYQNLSSEWLDKYYYSQWEKNHDIEVDEEKASAYLQEALDYTNNAIELFPELFLAHYNKGEILFNMQDYNSSLESFNRADSLWHNEARVLIWQGNNYYELSQYDEALESLNRAIEINPNLRKAYQIRADVLDKKGDEKKALDDLTMAMELYIIDNY